MSDYIITDVAKFLAYVKDIKTLSLDTETTGLMPYHGDKVFGISFSDGKDSWYYDASSYMPQSLKDFISDPTRTWYMANAKFDMHSIYTSFNTYVRGEVFDVLILARLAYNEHMSYSLGECAKRELGETKDDAVMDYIKEHKLWEWVEVPGKKVRKKKLFFDKVPQNILIKYACKDARLTYKLAEVYLEETARIDALFRPEDKVPLLGSLVFTEAALTKAIFQMEHTGVCIDTAYAQKCKDDIEEELTDLYSLFVIQTGAEYKASPKLFEKIFESEKHKWEYTEKGNPSFESDVLKKFTNQAAQSILRIRDLKSRLDFFATFLYQADKDGYVHPSFNSGGTTTGRFSSSDPNCLSLDTEVLTLAGWKNYLNVTLDDDVFCFDLDKKELVLGKPSGIYVSPPGLRKMIRLENEHLDISCTTDHRTLIKNRKSNKFTTVEAREIPRDCHILHGAYYRPYFSTALECSEDFLKFVVATQADGHIRVGVDGYLQLTFTFSKLRKIQRLAKIIESLNLKFRKSSGADGKTTTFYLRLPGDYFAGFLSVDKIFSNNLLRLSPSLRDLFIGELNYWDGLFKSKQVCYASKQQKNVSLVQALMALHGQRCLITHYKNKTGGRAYICWGARQQNYSGTANAKVKASAEWNRVWCLKVPTSYFLARRNGKTFITGNCQNMSNDEENKDEKYSIRKAIIPPSSDYCIVSMDYKQQEYALMLDYAQETGLIEEVKNGADVHEATAKLMGVSRKYAKTLNFMLLYGGGSEKLADSLGVSVDQAKELKQLYFSKLPKVEEFIRRVIDVTRTRGYIYNWAGRRFWCPDREFAYKFPNRIIQGGGADIMKKAMVRINSEILEKRGSRSTIALTVHDELVFYIHNEEISFIDDIKKTMEEVYPHKSLPMRVDISHSWDNLGSLQDGPPVPKPVAGAPLPATPFMAKLVSQVVTQAFSNKPTPSPTTELSHCQKLLKAYGLNPREMRKYMFLEEDVVGTLRAREIGQDEYKVIARCEPGVVKYNKHLLGID